MTYDMRIRIAPGEYWGTDEGYFRLNNNGMMKYVDVMYDFGMMHDSQNPVEEWPEWDFSLPEDEADRKYTLEMEKTTEPHGNTEFQTIPSHKFSSNDMWIVTKDEIKAALEKYESIDSEEVGRILNLIELNPQYLWYRWINFLELAAENEGFRVM